MTTHDCPQQRGRTLPCAGRDCAGALHSCWHCHDDPPSGHVCACCGALPRQACAACERPLPRRDPGKGGQPRVTCSKKCRQRLYDRRRGAVERGSVVPDHGTLARYRGSSTRPPCHCVECRSVARDYRYRYPGGSTTYDRKVLVDVLVYHYRDDIKGCGCGWSELGRSWPEHVATVFEESVAARNESSSP